MIGSYLLNIVYEIAQSVFELFRKQNFDVFIIQEETIKLFYRNNYGERHLVAYLNSDSIRVCWFVDRKSRKYIPGKDFNNFSDPTFIDQFLDACYKRLYYLKQL